MIIIECWIENPVRSLDRTFTYLSHEEAQPGARVSVPFGNRERIGFVEKCYTVEMNQEQLEKKEGYSLKYVTKVIDHESLITDELHDLALWMRTQTLSTAISCFTCMLPGKVKPAGKVKHIVQERYVRLSDEEVSLTPKQLEAYMLVKQKGKMKYAELRQLYPNQASVLIQKNAVISYEEERKAEDRQYAPDSSPLPLTDLQQKAIDEIRSSNDEVYLLRGVTGSGKTEIYLQLAAEQLSKGKQVLILVPEIGLTPQMIQRVSSRFHKGLAIYHSGLNDQEKYEQYKMVKEGQASIVVGTRSAVFLPFQNLGLIVMDEEHDASYKQDSQPCYHTRDIAIYRGRYHHCKVILGSATPSLESYARGLKNVYHLIEMKERINRSMPSVTIVPMRDSISRGESFILSDVLKQKIQERLSRHEQVILLLNRRGYHSLLRCRSCGEVIACPHCDLAMSWHKDIHKLKCHTCGTEMMLPKVCPSCGSDKGFASFGFGTERLEQEVHESFPDACILRMDADTTSRKNSHAEILDSFGKGKADILLGTQMIAKGLDYPNVTLVGVINGDEGLARTDYRSCEMTFDLLMQAGGRSGRGSESGEAVYQVFDPNHYAVESAAHQDYEEFFRHEMQFRHAGQYPPYTYLIALTFTGTDRRKAENAALTVKNALYGNFKTIGPVSLLKIKDMCRERILLKGRNLDEMRNAVLEMEAAEKADLKGLRIDVNPMDMNG
jgi:primosomal protein N' (replication factor Y)